MEPGICVYCSDMMLNLTSNQGNVNQNQSKIQYHIHSDQQKQFFFNLVKTNLGRCGVKEIC